MPEAQVVDVIVQPLYDTNTIPAAGSLNLAYFQAPIGAGVGNFGAAAAVKTIADTNMRLAGQLSSGYNFDLKGFRVQPAFTMTGTDGRNWSVGGVFTFTIASKDYLQVPLDTIPAGMGPAGYGSGFDAATVGTNRGVSHGAPHISNGYTIGKQPLRLSQTQNFFVTLTWVALSPVTSTVPTQPAAGLPVRVYLDGDLIRPVQ